MKHELQDKYFPVLSNGFVALKDFMGTDADIERAARVSYGQGTRKQSDTRTLLRYLVRHRHTSPLEMGEMAFHVRLPMDVNRQLIRHRTFNFNEYSTRYSVAIDACEKTEPDQWRQQASSNKQGSSGFFDPEVGNEFTLYEEKIHLDSRTIYKDRIKKGMAREQARKDLPLSTYTELYVKGDVHNMFHFLGLRLDSHAQAEIRAYANLIAAIAQQLFPMCFEAFVDYRLCSRTFSRLEMEILPFAMSELEYNGYVKDNGFAKEEAKRIGMGKREIEEFLEKLNPIELPKFVLPEPLTPAALAAMNHSNE